MGKHSYTALKHTLANNDEKDFIHTKDLYFGDFPAPLFVHCTVQYLACNSIFQEEPVEKVNSPTNHPNMHRPAAPSTQDILQEMQASIRSAARRRTLEEQQEYIISMLDPHDAATVFRTRGQGISETQLVDILTEKSKTRAAQALFDILPKIESGFSMLVDYFHDGKRNPQCAKDLLEEFEREEAALKQQVSDFVARGRVKEIDRSRRKELIRILRQHYDVKEDGQEILKA